MLQYMANMDDNFKHAKITVIIAIYNAEKYIRRAVQSIQNQTYDNWNLVLVDDGSTDASLMVCKELELKDHRIIVVHKENGGEASARNFGLRCATGEYICYVDADDHVEPTLLEDYITPDPTDLSICGIDMRWGARHRHVNVSPGTYYNVDIIEKLCDLDILVIGSSCNKLYKRRIIEDNNLRFPEDQSGIGIDHTFNWQYFQLCKSLRCIENLNYIYEENSNSLSHERSAKDPAGYSSTRLNYMHVLYNVFDKIKDKNIRKNCQKIYHGHFSDCILRPMYIHKVTRNNRLKIIKGYIKESRRVEYKKIRVSKGLFNKSISMICLLPINVADMILKLIFGMKKFIR